MSALNLDAIVNELYVPLFRFAASLARDSHVAADLTQHAFQALARHQDSLRDKSRVKAWLHTTVYREFLHGRRQRSRWISSEELTTEPADERPVPGTALGADEKEAIRRGIDRLEPMYRDALRLRYFQGLDYRSISRRLDIPMGTVMSRLSRAHRRLARYIEESSTEVLSTCLAR